MATEERRSHADVLFGDAAGIASADDAPPSPAARLVGTPPADGAWKTDAVTLDLLGADYPEPREMFPVETALRPALAERHDEVMTVLQLSQAERVQRHRAFVEVVRDSGLDPNVAGQKLYHLMTDAQIAAARRGVTVADDDARGDIAPTSSPVVEDLLMRLRAQLGPQRGERLVVATNAFIEQHPKLAAVLETPGFAAQPGFRDLLDDIVEHVRRAEHI